MMRAAALASRLREITGLDEDWMAARNPDAGAVPGYCHELLARCLGPVGESWPESLEHVRELSLGERDWLLLELRRRSIGPRIRGEVRCPHCQATIELDFASRDFPIENARHVVATLPSGRSVTVRPPTAEDHERFAQSGALTPVERFSLAVQRLVDGVAPLEIGEQDRDAIERALASATPEGVRLEIDCGVCGKRSSAPFDVCAFIFAEVREHSKTLIDDVHMLARTYHWSESEILRLSLRRRLAYLTRIDQERDAALIQTSQGAAG
ncbi:MAG TPA: hypothetical protein VER03_09965 [Bryobacteraceae bacterium]|nr:hypothetical protein [Bryobacteraceae bacterium]